MATAPTQVSPAKVADLRPLPIDQVAADPNQPRKQFSKESLDDLAASIKAEGLIQPIVVRPNGKGFIIVDGDRRHRAAQQAGLTEIPAIVREDLKDQDVSALQLVANIQRDDLTLAEQCDAVTRLVNARGFKPAAQLLGKSESWVSKRVNALKAPPALVKKFRDGTIKDLEVVGGLAELAELDEGQYEQMLENVGHEDPYFVVDRNSVRDAVEEAKEQKKYAEEARARDAAEDAKAKKGGSNKAKPAEKVSPEEAARRARESKIARVKDDRRALREAADAALYKTLQLKRQGWADPLDLRYGDDFPGAGSGDFAKFPATAEAAKFEVVCHGDINHLRRIAAGLPGSPRVELEPMTLSLEDAQRVSDALKGRPGAKFLEMHFNHEISGTQLRQMVAKLAPAAVSELPLPREERERHNKGQAGKAIVTKLPSGKAGKAATKKKARK